MKRILSILLALASLTAQAQLVITELMQSNIDCIIDDLNDFPDSWAELHNPGSEPVDLQGWRISTKSDFTKAYTLPSVTIDPDGYLLVFCDKAAVGMHTDFRIDSGKGDLYLFDASGNVITSVTKIPKQPAPNISYGLDDNGKWAYQLSPTPGAQNTGGIGDKLMPEPIFSVSGGVFAQGDNLVLSMEMPLGTPDNAKIIFTTDGTEPKTGASMEYDGSDIDISDNTVIRAKIVADGCLSRPSTVQSYIFIDREHQVPFISLVIDPEYLYGDKLGILVDGNGGADDPNYKHNWRRPLNVEIYNPGEAEAAINQLCETRVHGQTSRLYPMKSMVLYANKRFGQKRFYSQLWPKDKPDVTEPQSLILRNGGGAFSRGYIYDALAQRVMGRNVTTLDWQGYAPAVVYINGEYHGVLNMRERSDEDNIAANYGGLEDIDIIDYRDAEIEIENGAYESLPATYREFLEFIGGTHSYDEWAEMVDLESYADIFILHAWACDSDFPGNNQVLWRRTDGVDPRWRWLIKDLDQSFGLYNKWSYYTDYFNDWLANGKAKRPCYRMLFSLLDSHEFIDLFMSRFVAHTGTFLNNATIQAYLDEIIAENYDELAISHAKWNEIYHNQGNIDLRTLEYDFDKIRRWCEGRQRHIHQLMGDAFGFGETVSVRIMSDNDELATTTTIAYGGVELSTMAPTPEGSPLRLFDGYDYVGRTLQVEAIDTDIYGWLIKVGRTPSYVVTGNTLHLPIESTDKIRITMLFETTGIEDVAVDGHGINYDSASGIVSAPGSMIMLYDQQGRLLRSGIDTVEVPGRGLYIATACDPLGEGTHQRQTGDRILFAH